MADDKLSDDDLPTPNDRPDKPAKPYSADELTEVRWAVECGPSEVAKRLLATVDELQAQVECQAEHLGEVVQRCERLRHDDNVVSFDQVRAGLDQR